MNKKQKEAEQQEAKALLLRFIKPGQRVYTSLQHVSSSGMSRRIRTYVITEHEGREPQIWDCTRAVAKACGFRHNDDHGAIVVGGCGMDMGYHLVYSLSRRLFQEEGFQCTGSNCPHNSHFNEGTARDGTIYHTGDSGYALNHSWL